MTVEELKAKVDLFVEELVKSEEGKENLEKSKPSCDKIEVKEEVVQTEEKVEKSMDKIEVTKEQFDRLQKALEEDKKAEDLAKAAEAQKVNEPLVKSISDLGDLVKSLTDQVASLSQEVETFKKTPARDPKAITALEVVKKGGEGEPSEEKKLKKSDVLPVMLDLVKSSKISDAAVAEYEYCGQISDAETKKIIQGELKSKGLI